MAVKHIITRGYGFADGTKFIPTVGYSSSDAVPPPSGPWFCEAVGVFVPGAIAGESYTAGARQREAFTAGAQAAETN